MLLKPHTVYVGLVWGLCSRPSSILLPHVFQVEDFACRNGDSRFAVWVLSVGFGTQVDGRLEIPDLGS